MGEPTQGGSADLPSESGLLHHTKAEAGAGRKDYIHLYVYTTSMAKVTLSIDDELLQKYREQAVRKRGKMRSLSEEVEEVLRDRLANRQVLDGLKAVCCGRDDHFVTFDEVVAERFPGTPPAEEIIREMRRRRE